MTNNKQKSYENAVVSILLRNPSAIAKHEIIETWFDTHKHIIAAAKAVALAGNEVDAISINDHLKQPGLLQKLVELQTTQTGAIQNLQKYLDGLKEIHQSKQIRQILSQTLAEVEQGANLSDCIAQLMQSTLRAVSNESRNYSYTIKEAMGRFIDDVEFAFDARESGGVGLKTGITSLDKVLGGMHSSDMLIVGARPGVGKTAFGLSVLLNLAKSGKRVGFISTEMSASQVMLRITAANSGISGHSLRDASLQDDDWPKITAAVNKVTNLNFRIFDKPAVTIADVALQSKAWAIDGGVDFIVIDYLTRVKPSKSTSSQVQDVAEVVTGCKNMARQLNIPVMVLAQLNRESTKRADKRPRMADLRDSGVIEQEADQILLLHRDDDNDLAPAEIIIDKNRHGECATVRCHYHAETMEWANLQSNHEAYS